MQNAERRTQNAERRTQNARRTGPGRGLLKLGLIGLACTLTMCSKESPEPIGPAMETAATADILAKIQDFRHQYAQEARPKNLVDYSAEEAEFILEGVFNWGTMDPDAKYGDMRVDEFVVNAPMANGKVDQNDLLDAFAELEGLLNAAPLEADDKFAIMDVEGKVENGGLLLTTYRVSSKEEPPPTSHALNTNFTLNYKARRSHAGCTQHSADLTIQSRINQTIPALNSNQTVVNVQRWYVLGATDESEYAEPFLVSDLLNNKIAANTFPNPNDPDGIEPVWYDLTTYNDYLTYTTPPSQPLPVWDAPNNTCLAPTAMTYLTESAYHLATVVKNGYVNNNELALISCRVAGYQTRSVSLEEPQWFHWRMGHNVTYTYGKVITIGLTPG